MRPLTLPFVLAVSVAPFAVPAALGTGLPAQGAVSIPAPLLDGLDWRCIGPFRGGRVAAVCGVPNDRDTYWFGSVGGGVWKTTDGGKRWQCTSDGFFGGSIGAVAVAPSNPSIVYVGCGEKTWRGNVSSGDGLYKSTDSGKTWEFIGLPDSRHVSRIRVHPSNPDLVYAAVMGHVSGPNEERGVYRSKDGGQTWQRVLFANAHAGAVDLCFEPGNPQTLYASTWRAVRLPWTFESGGDGSALWQSTDGGDTWTDISERDGLPKGLRGIVGVTVSPADPARVWALIEAEQGGMFRSDDRGATWTKVNDDRNLRQRAWYYSRCEADPKDRDTVYVMNVQFHRSRDGGKTFERIGTPHSDNHDLWIDPKDPLRMIEGNDGGANVSYDGGRTWSAQDNQPTAQFYRVTTDTAEPYRVYGAQQDNSTVRIRSQSLRGAIDADDWESTAGGESGWLAPKPDDPEIVFGGSYGGYLQRRDHRTGLSRNVNVWPDNPLGGGADACRYRFQWNFPILFSKHDPNLLFTAGNVLFQSRDEGHTWTPISGDLTRDDKQKQGSSGGPITKDNTAVEYYCTIFAVAESPVQQGVIWCGSDDGLVHVTRDGGKNWQKVTPPGMPEWMQINCIEANPRNPGGAYVVGTRYKLDDFRPYLYATEDFGQTWREISSGLDPAWFARCLRADPVREGMLFCGTERGVWVSCDDGRRWQRLQRNLPITPVTDLAIHGDDLIAATQGRSFWIWDHLSQLRQVDPAQAEQDLHLFQPADVVLFPGRGGSAEGQGQNPARDASVRFWVGGDQEQPFTDKVKLEILSQRGEVLVTRSSDAEKKEERIEPKRGINAVTWDMQFADAEKFEGMLLWSGGLRGPRAAPGEYRIRLTVGERTLEQVLRLRKDPRSPASEAELQAKFAFVIECRDSISAAHRAIAAIRALRPQIEGVIARADADAKTSLEAQARPMLDGLREVEEALYQTKLQASQDALNYPIRLTDKLSGVMGAVNSAEFAPTAAQVAVKDELVTVIKRHLERYEQLRDDGVRQFNEAARKLAIPYIK